MFLNRKILNRLNKFYGSRLQGKVDKGGKPHQRTGWCKATDDGQGLPLPEAVHGHGGHLVLRDYLMGCGIRGSGVDILL